MKTILVYSITTPAGRKFTTKDAGFLKKLGAGAHIEVRRMTLAEYNCIPATTESNAFFGK